MVRRFHLFIFLALLGSLCCVKKAYSNTWNSIDSPSFITATGSGDLKKSADYIQYFSHLYALALVAYHKDTNLHKIRFKEGFKTSMKDLFSYERYKNDGLTQLLVGFGVSMGMNALFKDVFLRPRPVGWERGQHAWFQGGGGKSFYSGHATNAFTPAFFIAWRYGWLYSIPALITSTYVAYVRVAMKAHYITDVAMGAGMSALITYIFTHPYKIGKAQVEVLPSTAGAGASINVQW